MPRFVLQRRYPDPSRITRPTIQQPPFPAQLTSKGAGRLYPVHFHQAFVNQQGDGNTGTDASHYHLVRDFQILPAEDGHTHKLTGLPSGAGGAWRPPTR